MSHQVLGRQFSGVADLTYEKSLDSPKLRDEIPEQEDQDIGSEGQRITGDTGI